MPIHPPYTAVTLTEALQQHRDLIVAMTPQLYETPLECTWRAWAWARSRVKNKPHTLAHRAQCWSCYLHPATTDELTEHFRGLVVGWGTRTLSELKTVLHIEEELARPSSIDLVADAFLTPFKYTDALMTLLPYRDPL